MPLAEMILALEEMQVLAENLSQPPPLVEWRSSPILGARVHSMGVGRPEVHGAHNSKVAGANRRRYHSIYPRPCSLGRKFIMDFRL